jgi:hypothetical protein
MREPVSSELFSLLYVSRMVAPDAGEVARICRQSQARNEREGITGLLVFDGAAFCQLVEGPQAAVGALRHRLERDPRHVDMRVLHFGGSPARRFPSWRLGYAFVADAKAIEAVQRARSDSAIRAFDSIVGPVAPRTGADAVR